MEFVELIINIITEFSGYILGFFTYLVEMSKRLLESGNILFFVLFILIIWKVVMKLKG